MASAERSHSRVNSPIDLIEQIASDNDWATERTAYVLRVRQLAVAICKQYAAEEEATAAAERAKEDEI